MDTQQKISLNLEQQLIQVIGSLILERAKLQAQLQIMTEEKNEKEVTKVNEK